MGTSIIQPDRVTQAELSNNEIARYARHLIMPEVTLEGQKRLKASSILCIGMGGLGSSAALYLTAAGVGRLGLVDGDVVDFSNLQRQILHGTSDVGRRKVNSARDRLRSLNPEVQLDLYDEFFTCANARELVESYDLVIDGSDNFATRYLSNDVCVFAKKPNIYGAIYRFEGQCTVFAPHLGGPCYRCMLPEPPPPNTVPTCAEGGVLGVLPGLIGALQAVEAVKLILGIGTPLIGRLLSLETLELKFREFHLQRDPQCPVCGANPSITEPLQYEQFCGTRGERRKGLTESVPHLTPREVQAKLERGDDFRLIDVRDKLEWELGHIDGADLIPAGEIPSRMSELDSAKEIVLICRDGQRSAQVAALLQEAGFERLAHVEGGMQAWAEQIDPSLPNY